MQKSKIWIHMIIPLLNMIALDERIGKCQE